MHVPGRFRGSFYILKVGLVVTVLIAALWILFFVNWSSWFNDRSKWIIEYAHATGAVSTTQPDDSKTPTIPANKPIILPSPLPVWTTDTPQFQSSTDFDEILTPSQIVTPTDPTSPVITEPLPLCSESPPKLVGPLAVNFEQPTFEEIAAANPLLKPGGWYRPPDCIPRNGPTAIIVPYRNRELQLRGFLHHMHPILQRQLLEYVIIVVEQAGDRKFNRALLMNIGFNESLKLLDNGRQFQCYVFHDVDLLPEDDRGIYTCKEKAIHLSGYIDKFDYKIPYGAIFGGASAIPRQHFELINGYSNVYFGWGGEDDDIHDRLIHLKLPIMRYDKDVLRYKMFKHTHEPTNSVNENRMALLRKTVARMHSDGINSLSYKLIRRDDFPTYTRVTVEFNEQDVYKAVFGKPTIQF